MARPRTKPRKEDLIPLRDAYLKFEQTSRQRALNWHNIDVKTTEKEFLAIQKADTDALELVQKAFIAATSYVNSADKWPLVTEDAIVTTLCKAKLWPNALRVSQVAYRETDPTEPKPQRSS